MTDAIYDWGLQVIKFIQQAESPFLTAIMKGISFLGSPAAYILYVGILYWAINQKQGMFSVLVVSFSNGVNSLIKETLRVPRPYQRDFTVGLDSEKGFSTPSGHSQCSSSFWAVTGRLFSVQRAKSVIRYGLVFGLPFLIGLSRCYLGVHYPTDVLLGWGLGYGIAGIAMLLYPFIVKHILPQRKTLKLLCVAIISFIFLKLNPNGVIPAALFLGFGFGGILLFEKTKFVASIGTVLQKILRCIIGFGGAGVIFFIFKVVIIPLFPAQLLLVSFLQYFVTSLWCAWFAPLVFIALKIAQVEVLVEEETVSLTETKN